MPFIVQCPHPECRKYMLLEESVRGSRVECLVCRRTIAVEGSGSHDEVTLAPRESTPPAKAPTPVKPPPRSTPVPGPSPWSSPVQPTLPAGGPPAVSGSTPPPVRHDAVVNCPACQSPLRKPPNSAGRSIRCPKCQHVFRV